MGEGDAGRGDAGRAEPQLSPCAQIVRRGDPDRFLAAMTAPPALRERLFALYAFNIEAARATQLSEPMLGHIRLQWWREVLDAAFDGAEPRRHDVAQALTAAIREAGLARGPLERILDARGRELDGEAWGDAAALRAYLADTGGALLAVSAAAAGAPCDAQAEDAGFGFAVAAWLRACPALIAQGARPLPVPADELAAEGLARIAAARGAPRAAAPAFRAGWRAGAALRQATAPGYDPAVGPRPESEARRRLGLIWLALRGRW